MNFYKHLNLLIFVILLEIISNSSADEWKKLKRKLIALSILHGIRVKTIIPLPVPLPLPVVVRKTITNPIVLPSRRVPFLVPKPVPYYKIIPNFVPIYPKDTESNPKHWTEDGYQLAAQQTMNEDYSNPSESMGMNQDIYKLSASDINQAELMPMTSLENQNQFNFNGFNGFQDQSPPNFISEFEFKPKSKNPIKKLNRKLKKQIMKPFRRLKPFNYEDWEEEYEDLMMLSTEPKTQPEETATIFRNNSKGKATENREKLNKQRQQSTRGLSNGTEFNKQMPEISDKNNGEVESIENKRNRGEVLPDRDSHRVKTVVKKIKVGEIRLRTNQLKALLAANHRRISH